MKNVAEYFQFEVRQLESHDSYWQGITVTCSLPGSDYTFQLRQRGTGKLPKSNSAFFNQGERMSDFGTDNDYDMFVDDIALTSKNLLNSNRGYMEHHFFGEAELEVLLLQIANDDGTKFDSYISDDVRGSLRRISEDKPVEKVSSSEVSWLSIYWGVTA